MRSFLLVFFFIATVLGAQAQDVILRTNGDEVKAQVVAITPEKVAYVPATEPPSTDTLYMPAPEVFMIRYANGTKEVLAAAAPAPGLGRTPQEMLNQGRQDARRYFKAPGAFWGTFGATFITVPFLGGLGGIATGTAIAVSPPKDNRIVVPNKELLADANYMRGYEKQAQRKKLGKAATGFGVGLVTGAVVWVGVALANTRHF
jgi:hypothetical protein